MKSVAIALAAGLAAADTTTTVYTLEKVASTGDCGEVDIPTADVKKAQLFDRKLAVGHCADKGFKVADGVETKKVPVLGSLTIRKYKKAATSGNVHADRAAQIEHINNVEGVLWKAAAHPRFASQAPGASKDLCGVKNITQQGTIIDELIKMGEMEEFRSDSNAAIPDSFDSEQNWPQCAKIIGDIRDQSNCGCCWAFAGAEAASDRMCIATNASMMVPLSAQDVCFNGGGWMSQGCNGGQITSPWSYMKKGGWFGGKGAVSGGQYQGTGPFGKGFCSDFSLPHCHHHGPQGSDPYPAEGAPGCPHENSPSGPRTCDSDAKAPHNNFADDKYSYEGQTITARGETAIKQAVMAGGPMEVAFTVYSDFENYAGGIYHHTTGGAVGGHAVKVVGWGVESGVKYWKLANSWNPYWGEKGYFRIRVGEGGIDDQAVASSPNAKWSRAGDTRISQPEGVDCSKSKCPSECQCAKSKCADSINACLADPACAKGQSCGLSCGCGDKMCAIRCELANPSAKAFSVGKCVIANCAKSDIVV